MSKPYQLRPSECVRLLNSTPLGEVLTDRMLRKHRDQAGYRIGKDRVDLIRYSAWLYERANEPKGKPVRDYEDIKEAARARSAELAATGRDIGAIPDVVDPERKKRASTDFKFYCTTYFPEVFDLEFSSDHDRVIAKIEQAVLSGGLFAMAMPRGSGKSTLAEAACHWAVSYGHREFCCLIGDNERSAMEMLESIKKEFETNELLLEDFPEICYPIRALDGIANRCAGQTCGGKRTYIGWTAKEIVLPTIAGSAASGCILRVAGITGRIRGMKHKRADGRPVRPSLVIIDDPQSDESARSKEQCQVRERTLMQAVLGLAGPGKKIAGVMPCTVIQPNDLADRLLDREKHPQWQGEKTKMLYALPENKDLWDQYARLRESGLREGRGLEPATEFYREHRIEMDRGALAAWPERFNYDEISAVQNAMNLLYQDERAFWAEYQNEPLPDNLGDDEDLTVEQVMSRIVRRKRGSVPLECTHLTSFIDVQLAGLFWTISAWTPEFGGHLVDYGAYPEQPSDYFMARDMRNTLAQLYAPAGFEGALYSGLTDLVKHILDQRFERDDGAKLNVSTVLIDANWGRSTSTVKKFCREIESGPCWPAHGRYVGAASIPFDEYKRKRGDRVGWNWRMPSITGKQMIRHVLYDTNAWKTFMLSRLKTAIGDPSAYTIFGASPEEHRLLAEHWTAEYHVKTEGRGRTVDEWQRRPDHTDEHWWDGLVGTAVAASMEGIVLPDMFAGEQQTYETVDFAELQKRANER